MGNPMCGAGSSAAEDLTHSLRRGMIFRDRLLCLHEMTDLNEASLRIVFRFVSFAC
jgi:hypothetical protein